MCYTNNVRKRKREKEMKYYVIACGWMGMNEEEMKEVIMNNDTRFFDVYDNYEEAEARYFYQAENNLDDDECCYIFDGNNIIKELQ